MKPASLTRGCIGKVRYPTESAARSVVGRMLAQARRGELPLGEVEKLNVYKCQHCSSYHLGRNRRKETDAC